MKNISTVNSRVCLILQVVEKELLSAESEAHYKGYGVLRLFKCLLLQFMEDLSDRELERYISDSNAAKWFCDFSLVEKTPAKQTKKIKDKDKDKLIVKKPAKNTNFTADKKKPVVEKVQFKNGKNKKS